MKEEFFEESFKEIKLIKDFIRYLINNNDYYYNLFKEYNNDEDKSFYTNAIYDIFCGFNSKYSIYCIMDNIVYKMQTYNKTCKEILEDKDNFDLEV